jgi:hypothetical protein
MKKPMQFLIVFILISFTQYVFPQNDSKTVDVTKGGQQGDNTAPGASISRTTSAFRDSWINSGFIREMNITVGGNYVIKRADSVSADISSQWLIVPDNEYSLQNIKRQSVKYQGVQHPNISSNGQKIYAPQFSGLAGPSGGSGNSSLDYNWTVTTGSFAIYSDVVGVVGDSQSVEGSFDVITILFFAKRENGTGVALKVRFKINWASSSKNGIHWDDFVPNTGTNSTSINIFNPPGVVSQVSGTTDTYEIDIPANSNQSSLISLGAKDAGNYFAQVGSFKTDVNFIEKATMTVVKNVGSNDKYVPDTFDPPAIPNLPAQKAREIMELIVIDAVTRFGGQNDNSSLADGSDNIDLNDIIQGQIGNCYYAVLLMALADKNSVHLQNRTLEENNSTKFTVKAYNATGTDELYVFDMQLPGLDNQIFLNSDFALKITGDYVRTNNINPWAHGRLEIWPQLYERSWVKKCGSPLSTNFGGATVAVQAWCFLTSKACNIVGAKSAGKNSNTILAEMNAALNTSNSCGLWIGVANVPTTITNICGGIPAPHVYYVKNISSNQDFITLINPWGHSHVDLPKIYLSEVVEEFIPLTK